MKLAIKLLWALLPFLISSNVLSNDFCKLEELNKKSKAKTPVIEYSTEIAKLGNILISSKKEDCKFIKDNMNKNDFIIIDARGRGTRGVIRGAVKVISDHDDLKNHQFTPEIFQAKLKRYTDKKENKIKDPKKANLIIFCNGPTCYRTSWAACSLKEMGYDKSKINLVLDGYFGLKKNCL